MINKQIERKANDILKKHGVLKLPIPIENVVEGMGLRIKPFDLGENISGVLVMDKGNGTIGINPSESRVRQRFTIAHELGHFILHWQESGLFIDKGITKYKRDHNSSRGDIKKEFEANAFAAAVLMPEKLLVEEIKKSDLDISNENSMKQLAQTFGVSEAAMTFRIANLQLVWKLSHKLYME